MKFKYNKEIVQYFGREFVSGNDLAVYEEIVARNFVDHTSPNGNYDSMLATFQGLRAALPDMEVVIYKLIEEGDCVTSLKSLKGTHTGESLFGIAPSGKKIQIDLIDIIRIKNGQFIENWAFNNISDVIVALQQNQEIPYLIQEKQIA